MFLDSFLIGHNALMVARFSRFFEMLLLLQFLLDHSDFFYQRNYAYSANL